MNDLEKHQGSYFWKRMLIIKAALLYRNVFKGMKTMLHGKFQLVIYYV